MAILGQQAGVSTARPFVFGAGAAFVAFGLMTAKLDSASSLIPAPANTHPPSIAHRRTYTSPSRPRLAEETLAGSEWYNKYPPSGRVAGELPTVVRGAHHFENSVSSTGPPALVQG